MAVSLSYSFALLYLAAHSCLLKHRANYFGILWGPLGRLPQPPHAEARYPTGRTLPENWCSGWAAQSVPVPRALLRAGVRGSCTLSLLQEAFSAPISPHLFLLPCLMQESRGCLLNFRFCRIGVEIQTHNL